MSWFNPFVTYKRGSLVAFMVLLISLESLSHASICELKAGSQNPKKKKKRKIDLKTFVAEKFTNQDIIIQEILSKL